MRGREREKCVHEVTEERERRKRSVTENNPERKKKKEYLSFYL